MSIDQIQSLAPLMRCSSCRGWHRVNDTICPLCGVSAKQGAQSVLRRSPVVMSVTAAVICLSVYMFLWGGNVASRMSALIFVVGWTSVLRHVWPKRLLLPKEPPRTVEVSLRSVRERIREAQSRAQALPATQHLTAELILLNWRLNLLNHTNRSVPVLYGPEIAGTLTQSDAELTRHTIDRLHALDGTWISSRLSGRPAGERALGDLAALIGSVKASTGTAVGRLLAHDLGHPMPGVDIEEQVLAVLREFESFDEEINTEYVRHLNADVNKGSDEGSKE